MMARPISPNAREEARLIGGVLGTLVGAPLATLLAILVSDLYAVGLFTVGPLVVRTAYLVVGIYSSTVVSAIAIEAIRTEQHHPGQYQREDKGGQR
jgi:hypothetical protein